MLLYSLLWRPLFEIKALCTYAASLVSTARPKTHGSMLHFGPVLGTYVPSSCAKHHLRVRSVTIAHGGVLPNIHSVLLPKKTKSSKGKGDAEASEEF